MTTDLPTTATSSLTRREPAVVIGTLVTLATAVLTVLVAFGLDISTEQQAALGGLVLALGPVLTGITIRRQVTPADR